MSPARLVRPLFVLILGSLSLFVIDCKAQVANVDDTTSTPIEGAGHDYIHQLSETVNPANGSMSLRIQVPMPKGRGITIPFGYAYDSNAANHMTWGVYPTPTT